MKDVSANTEAKRAAGIAAAGLVDDMQTVGLGTGSTAAFAIAELGRRVREDNLRIECVATSFSSQRLAIEAGLSIVPIDACSKLNLSIDGADEIDPGLHLIKGGGAAHTLEKLVHAMSDRFVCVADPSKIVDVLGAKFAVPVEILPQSLGFVERKLNELGAVEVSLRMAMRKDGPVITDSGNLVLDARFPKIDQPIALEDAITTIPGVLENGIFGHVRPRPGDCIIGDPDAPGGLRKL